MTIVDWGSVDYLEAWKKQEDIFNAVIADKRESSNLPSKEQFILCEHPHVYTLGKSGDANNLLISEDFLKQVNATFYKIDRGGDITYHGPGQIVGYPILDLERQHLSLKQYIFNLEEVIIDLLKLYGITGERLSGATGVWLDANSDKARKICAIGVRASRFVTMHGFALNVNTNLQYFNYINPCGFTNKGVASIEKELNQKMDIREVKEQLCEEVGRRFKSSARYRL